MKELEVKNTIKKAMAEPKTPEDLMRATIERGKAIETGRLAEKTLASLKNATPSNETKKLAAQSIVGRYMMTRPAKNGITAEKMTSELLKNEKFAKAANMTADKLLEGLKNGKLMQNFTQLSKEKAAPQAAPQTHKNEGPGLAR